MADTTKYAVIVAGGIGARMGSALPKQFLPLLGKPVLYYAIKAFIDAVPGIHLVLVLPADQLSYAQMVLQHFPERIDITIVAGGGNRFYSVQNGLKAVGENSIVFIHDGARPLVSAGVIQTCLRQAIEKGSAIPAVAVADSMRMVGVEESSPVNRDHLRIIQTPQTFKSEIILPAYLQEYRPSFTDEATVVEACGQTVHLVEGERGNIKVTTPEDLIIAGALLKERMNNA